VRERGMDRDINGYVETRNGRCRLSEGYEEITKALVCDFVTCHIVSLPTRNIAIYESIMQLHAM
jgi:hypothetical protein